MSSNLKAVIASGDPAGCGPLISLEAIREFKHKNIDFILVGDRKVFERFAVYRKVKNRINLIDLNTSDIKKIKPGQFSKLSGKASLAYLDAALAIAKENRIKRLVTAPLSKEAVQMVKKNFSGHTEYLQNYFKVPQVEMMMVSKHLKTVLLTRHTVLRKAGFLINAKGVEKTLKLVYAALKEQFKIKKPRIALAAFNPHAGVSTFLEREEKELVAGIRKFKYKVYGPYPADSLFIPEKLKLYDCIISAYHDQGMVAFKLLSMKSGVNLTLGLPIIRTSPAHGPAFDLMRRHKKPFSSSMLAAIKLAIQLNIP